MGIIGYYKRDRRNAVRNRVKYYVISCILDILVLFQNEGKGNNAPTFSEVMQRFDSLYSNFDTDFNVPAAQIEIDVLLAMNWMGLLYVDKEDVNKPQLWKITLSDKGKQAYQDQKFHTISANLYAAKEASTLSKVAIAIALTSLLVAIISMFI